MRGALARTFVALILLTAASAQAEPPPTAEEAVPKAVPGVRVWLHSSADDAQVKLYLRDVVDGREAWVLVCPQACRVVLPRGAKVRTTYSASDPRDFELMETGRDVEIDVRGPSRAAMAGGIVMVSIGSLTTLIGAIVFGLGASSAYEDGSAERTGGLVTILVGGALTVGGSILMINRPKAPRVEQFSAQGFSPKRMEQQGFPVARSAVSWGFSF